jgi:hypothetical protein
MSKGNRIKGKFNEVVGARNSSMGRMEELHSRTLGLSGNHQPKSSKKSAGELGIKTLTKRLRKQSKKFMKDLQGKDCHPLARKASVSERGYAKIVGLVSSTTMVNPNEVQHV